MKKPWPSRSRDPYWRWIAQATVAEMVARIRYRLHPQRRRRWTVPIIFENEMRMLRQEIDALEWKARVAGKEGAR